MDRSFFLTPKQLAVFEFLKNYVVEHTHAPTVVEIQRKFKWKSTRSVTQVLESLESKGLIRRDRFQHRSITLLNDVNPLSPAGTVRIPVVASAGADAMEVYAEQRFNEFLRIDKRIAGSHRDIAAVKVVGNSMIDAGIFNGDYVLVEVTENVNNGDRVVAIVGEMAVVKRFQRFDSTVVLSPENKVGGYDPIVARLQDVKIFGRVVSVIPGNDRGDDVEFIYENGFSR